MNRSLLKAMSQYESQLPSDDSEPEPDYEGFEGPEKLQEFVEITVEECQLFSEDFRPEDRRQFMEMLHDEIGIIIEKMRKDEA